jgi:hypothetical protein
MQRKLANLPHFEHPTVRGDKTMSQKIVVLILAVTVLISQFGWAGAQSNVRRISFPPGADSATRTGVLTMGGADRYVLKASAGQNMTVSAASANNNVILVIFGKDGTVLISDHADASSWSGQLPSTQDYYIDVRAIDGTSANYTLTVTVPPNPPTPPHPTIKRIRFAPGTISATVNGTVTPGGSNEYVLAANAGQPMYITTDSDTPVTISVWGADGTVLQSPMGGISTFSGDLPSTQDYFIQVDAQGSGATTFQMTVTVEPN